MKRKLVFLLVFIALMLVISAILWRYLETRTLTELRDAVIVASLGTGIYVLFVVLRKHFDEPPW